MDKAQMAELERGDLYLALSLSFSYPAEERVAGLKVLLEDMISVVDPANPYHRQLELMQDHLDADALVGAYSDLFLKGAVPLNESSCTPRFETVADAAGFYKAFGLNPEAGDTPDALPYELEFMSILCLKIAQAPDDEKKEIAQDAYRKFLDDHLLDFVKKFCAKLERHSAGSFYGTAAQILESLVLKEAQRRGLPERPLPLDLPILNSDEPVDCP